MDPIIYIDRTTKKEQVEMVCNAKGVELLYGNDWISRVIGGPLLHLLLKRPLFSVLYGYWQDSRFSKKNIAPFIDVFGVDSQEFVKDVGSFTSFNDFFIRKLRPSARPIAEGDEIATMPADGRCRFYQNIALSDGFIVKGQKFTLTSLLNDKELAAQYEQGAMVIARLCPTDYHRYHFPCACIPSEAHLINGCLHSVNPAAIRKNIDIFSQNKRTVCTLKTQHFGSVLFVEVGALLVGGIENTYTPNEPYSKGAEKGFFYFGGSTLILLFKPRQIEFDKDLIEANAQGREIKCLMGQSMGKSCA